MRYHNITKDDMLNGDGLRVVLWVAGCSHGCVGCHNPETWDINGGIEFDDKAKSELFEELGKDYISGLTLSGGDPLHPSNLPFIRELVKEVKEKFPTKTIWLYTGYIWGEIESFDFIPFIDVVVDGKFIQELHDPKLHWKGSENQLVIDVSSTLAKGEIILHGGNYEKSC